MIESFSFIHDFMLSSTPAEGLQNGVQNYFRVGNKDTDTTSIDDDLLYVFVALNNFYTPVQNFYWLLRTRSYLLITR